MGFGFRCAYLPWHKIVESRRVSFQSMYARCSCGREYGVNMHERIVLPWATVRDLYDNPPSTPDSAKGGAR